MTIDYSNLSSEEKKELARFFGHSGANPQRTLDNWSKSENTQLQNRLQAYMSYYHQNKETNSIWFQKDGDEIWFLLDAWRLSTPQVEKIIDILSLSSREIEDFKKGRRYEVLVSPPEETTNLLKILN